VTGSVITGGSPQVTTMAYDAAGDRTLVKDPAASAWSYTFDLLGRQTKAVDADSGTTVTGYDAASNVAYTTNGAGVTVNYTYDALNRRTAEYTGSTTQGSSTQIATWTWDTLKKGLLTSESSVANGVTYRSGALGYDAEGDVSGSFVTVPVGQPLAGTYRTQYAYTTTGLLTSQTPAAGGGLPVESITYAYDKFGNPTSENGLDTYASGAVWTPFNEISQIDLGSGPSAAALTYSYDPQNRNMTGINLSDQQPSPQVDNIAYTYNADQQVTQIADTQGGTGAPVEDQCFSYDSLSRLTEGWTSSNACATNPADAGNGTVRGPEPYWQSWTLDPEGDILTATNHAPAGNTGGDTTTAYHYAAAGHVHAVSSATATNTVTGTLPSTSFEYDGAGDTTTLGSQALTWNPNGKLATAGTATSPSSYVYAADGDELVESDTSGGTTTTTLYLPGEQLTTDGTTTTGERSYSFAGQVVGETSPSTLFWLAGSVQGTMTTAVAAFSQSTVIRRASTPYGTMLTGSGTWPDNKGFLGDPAHSATSLVDVGARKYDPATGLFISVDPILSTGTPQTMTGYTYSADNPVTNMDPTGELMFFHGGAGGGGDPPTPPPAPAASFSPSSRCILRYGCGGSWRAGLPSGGGGFHLPHWMSSALHSTVHFVVHDVVPVAAGFVAFAGCDIATGGTGVALCAGAGFAVYGYTHNAIETHSAVSWDNVRAGVDAGAFGYCLAATAAMCGAVSLGATGVDYGVDVHNTGSWTGDAGMNALRGLALDTAGFGLGKLLEEGADAAKALRAIGPAPRLGIAGGASLPLGQMLPRALSLSLRMASRLSQTTIDNWTRVANFQFGTVTCTSPVVTCPY
jgi:RHS repeat-associated protein